MRKKIITILLLIILATSFVYSETNDFKEYEPYSIEEFPQWSWKLRRGESLFFGSLAITFPVSVLAYSMVVNSPLVENKPTDNFTNFKYQLSIAAVLSLSIAIGDYIVGEME